MYRTMNTASEYRLTPARPGRGGGTVRGLPERPPGALQRRGTRPAENNRGRSPGPVQRGPDRAPERQGIAEAALYFEKREHLWKMTLKGDTFHFGLVQGAEGYRGKRQHGGRGERAGGRSFSSGWPYSKRGCSCSTPCMPSF